MRAKSLFLFAGVLGLLLSGCQQLDGESANIGEDSGVERSLPGNVNELPLVQGADGTQYDVTCLRANATTIMAEGRTAMSRCAVNASTMTDTTRSRLFFYGGNNNSWYYWPLYYWDMSNQNSYYNYYFCSFIFGTNWGSGCFSDLFGYDYKKYYNKYYKWGNAYYNQNCYYCYYYASDRQNRCFRECAKTWDLQN